MKRFLLFVGVALAVIVALWWSVTEFQMRKTKSSSPEDHVAFQDRDLEIRVFYNRPYKKEREIFGKLVPFNKVWRTGANEATTFETNKDLTIEGKVLKKGKYSLWTIPGQETWRIIFNTEHGQWGINSEGEANRNPDRDVLAVDFRAMTQETEFEQFTIAFNKVGEEAEMVLFWDKTLVSVPFSF